MLHWLDENVIVLRQSYVQDKSSFSTVFTSILSSVQQDDVPIQLGGGGYAARTFTVFMDNSRSVLPMDILVRTDGTRLKVLGTKVVVSGSEPYQQVTAEEWQED